MSAAANDRAMVTSRPKTIHCCRCCRFFLVVTAALLDAILPGDASRSNSFAISLVGAFAAEVAVTCAIGIGPNRSGMTSTAESQLSIPSRQRNESAVMRRSAIQSTNIGVVAGPYCPPLGGRTNQRASMCGSRLAGISDVCGIAAASVDLAVGDAAVESVAPLPPFGMVGSAPVCTDAFSKAGPVALSDVFDTPSASRLDLLFGTGINTPLEEANLGSSGIE
jgi:hypothetical protein